MDKFGVDSLHVNAYNNVRYQWVTQFRNIFNRQNLFSKFKSSLYYVPLSTQTGI